MKSNLLKKLGKVSDYLFGFGDGTYAKIMNFYENNYEGYEKKVEIYSERIHDKIKIIIRSLLTSAEAVIIYNSLKNGNNSNLEYIPFAEAIKFWSYNNEKKRINNINNKAKSN